MEDDNESIFGRIHRREQIFFQFFFNPTFKLLFMRVQQECHLIQTFKRVWFAGEPGEPGDKGSKGYGFPGYAGDQGPNGA